MNRHLLLDRPFHPHETDAELIFHQLAHCTHAAIGERVDVVDPPEITVQTQQV